MAPQGTTGSKRTKPCGLTTRQGRLAGCDGYRLRRKQAVPPGRSGRFRQRRKRAPLNRVARRTALDVTNDGKDHPHDQDEMADAAQRIGKSHRQYPENKQGNVGQQGVDDRHLPTDFFPVHGQPYRDRMTGRRKSLIRGRTR